MSWDEFNKSKTRMYSLNLAAYIMTATELVPDTLIDEETRTCYWVYPECTAIDLAIKEYKSGTATVNLRDFLSSIKKLRTTMKTVLGE